MAWPRPTRPRPWKDETLKDRVFVQQEPTTVYLWMNNDVPPFDNVKVRQAVNYAIDREAIQRVWGGPSQAQITDQILPFAMEGWQDVDNYPASRTWTRPNSSWPSRGGSAA